MSVRSGRKNVGVAMDKDTYLSPRRSMAYAFTPPGILTSTRTSTRENALKQLRHRGINGVHKDRLGREGVGHHRDTNAPEAAIFHLPSWTLREPRLRFFDRIC